MKKPSLFSFLLSFSLNLCFAQNADLEFKHFTTADGLVTNWMIDCPIEQDDQGFIWIGSDHGLHKYDGYNFNIYTYDENDSLSISNNSIKTIHRDRQGRLWIGTSSGLNKWHSQTESFKKYFFADKVDSGLVTIRKISEDQEGNLWIAGDDIFLKFNPNTETVTSYNEDADKIRSLLNNNIYTSYLDKNDMYWIGGKTGLVKYNLKTSGITHFDLRKARFKMGQSNIVTCIAEDLSGRLLIGGEESLYLFDRQTETLEALRNLENNSLKIFTVNENSNSPDSQYVNFIFQSPATQEYWIGLHNQGITRFDASGKLIGTYKQDLSDTRPIFEDRSGVIWLGTPANGIYKSRLSASNFEPQGYGLDVLDILSDHHILSIMEDNSGNLWISTVEGILYKYNPESKKLTDYGRTIAKTNNLGKGPIPFIYQDSKERIWIGTMRGLSLFQPGLNSFKTYYVDPQTKSYEYNYFVMAAEDSAENLTFGIWKFPENYVRFYSFSFDENTGKGLLTHNPDYNIDLVLKNNGGKVKKLSESVVDQNQIKLTIHSAMEDKNGIVWIGASEGLLKYNPLTTEYKLFTTKDGFPVNTMGGILEDDEGYLWVANSAGLLKVNPNDDSFVQFGKEDGLDNNLFEEQKAAFKSKNGLLYFGGFNGLTVIDPKRFNANSVKPQVLISGFKIFGESVSIGKDAILNKSISFTDQIELDYNQNDLTIDYLGLHYKNPEKNKYAYKLEPYQEEWINAENERSAHYTNLAAGEYTFYVKAANSDGIWNDQGRQLSIIINPPLWATWWAYFLYILILGGILLLIRRFELKRRLLQAENKRKSEELEEARQLQLSMLPKELPQLPQLDIAVYMQTATEVGGDYYDFNVSMDGTLTVVIGDATGHGMKAGTMVTTAKSLFKSYGSNPDILFSFQEFSRCIKEMNFGRIAMCLTMVKINDHTLKIATAGMPPSYIYRSKTKVVEEYQFEAMPLGAMKEFQYKVKNTKLSSGDTVLLLSDGLPELENKNSEMFGYNRIKNGFERIADKSPDDIISYLKNEGASWADNGDPDDDVTFVVIKVK